VRAHRAVAGAACALSAIALAACHRDTAPQPPRASGYVEATEVKIASKVAGRVASVAVQEGARVQAQQVVVTLETTETDLALTRAQADRDQATAQLRLLQAGSRPEDIQQAQAQVQAAEADRRAADADLTAAKQDEARFDQLLKNNAGSQKQYDDAVARRAQTEARLKALDDRAKAATATLDRVKAGARPQELDAARAHVASVDAQIAALQHDRAEATIVVPTAGVVSSRLIEPGELVAPGTPLLVVIDLDHAWATAYVEEPIVPSLTIDEAATVVTDAGDRLSGKITFIASQAEFTPRNVQTTDERAKLVYRVKVTVDNRAGTLKPGMPVQVEFTQPAGK
jgi:HlyD family secretion protein